MPTRNYYISADTEKIIHDKYEAAAKKYSKKFKVDTALIRAITQVESVFNPFAVRFEPHLKRAKWYTNTIPEKYKDDQYAYCSMGYMQVLYGIARDYGFKGTPQDLMSPDNSVHYGTKHLANFLKRWKKVEDAISAYNQGRPRKDKDTGEYKNQRYVDDVMRFYRQFGGQL